MENNYTFKSILTLLCFAFAIVGYAQDRNCGMVEYMEQQLQDSDFAKEWQMNQEKFKEQVQSQLELSEFGLRGGGTPTEIPVAVHFVEGNEADRACLEALAQIQVDILNADYTATNSDINLWNAASSIYPGLVPGAANIQFCLAVSNHPTGFPQLTEGQPAVTIGYNFGGGAGNADPNWSGYMNFVVRTLPGGILGFSPLGGSVTAGQAVTMNTFSFGSGPGCNSGASPQFPFNLGRTVTHELGHFYNLNHPWGPGAPTCAQDDGIADTPLIGVETYGCATPGSVAGCVAGQSALTMNFMDYADDRCMYMFTPQQMIVAQNYVNGVLLNQFKPGVCQAATASFELTANNSPVFSCPTTDTSVDFDLTYTTIAGFSENTTFSASGVPAGASVNFTPSQLNADGNVTMTIGNIGATMEGSYTITVTGTSPSITESVDVVLNNNCTSIQCNPYNPNPADLPLAITDGQNGGGLGTPVAQTTVNIPNMAIIESMTVTVDLTHTYVNDLVLQLQHPNGTDFINLWAQDCGSENFNNTVITFDDMGSAISCPGGTATDIASGTIAPSDPLSTFTGLDAQGDWTLLVADFFAGDIGTLNALTIDICAEEDLSVTEFDRDSFAIFPNPNNGEFTIKLNSNSGKDINVDVYDIRGRRIFENSFNNTGEFNETINLNTVQAGMYLVTVNDGNNEVTKRIIVD